MIEIGQEYTIEITGVSHQGFGVGRIEGMVVFIPTAMLGEIITARIDEIKKNLAYATLITLSQASEQRITPTCQQSDRCGGCELQHAHYTYQLEAKRQIVQDAIRKLAQTDVMVPAVIGMDDPWRYRNKGMFHVAYIAGAVQLGFYQANSHEVVPADECHLFSETVNQLLRYLSQGIQTHSKAFYIQKVMIRESRANGEIMVVFVTKDNTWRLPQLSELLSRQFPQVTSVYHNINTNPKVMLGKSFQLLWGKPFITDTIGELNFQISPQSFFQINNHQAQVLYQQVLAFANLQGNEQVVDAYCGIGTIALTLAKHAKTVYGVESVSQAVKDANINAQLNDIVNCQFTTAKAEEWLPKWIAKGNRPDLIVVDPPRKGCDSQLLHAITTAMPPKIIYVSCDPATMARDARYLIANGYQIEQVQPVDMFSQSWHVETVCLLSKLKADVVS